MQNPDQSDEQDRIWLALVAQGGRQAEKAIEALYRKYERPLRGFLVRRGLGVDDAEDVVQEVFIRVVKSAETFRQEARVSSWLHQIARNLHIDHARRSNPETSLDDDGWAVVEGQEGHRAAVAFSEAQASACAAESLQLCYDRGFAEFTRAFPDCAEALRHIVHDAWAIRDLANCLRRTEGATREYLSQCRKKLKAYLEPCRRFLSEV